jgi:hypothetical protein
MKYLAYLNILFGDNHMQNGGNCKKGGLPFSIHKFFLMKFSKRGGDIIQLMTFDKVDTMVYQPRRSDNDQGQQLFH